MSLTNALAVRHQLLGLTDHPHAMHGSRGGFPPELAFWVGNYGARGYGIESVSRGIINFKRRNESYCSLCASIVIFISKEPIYLVFYNLGVDFVSGDLDDLAPLQLTSQSRIYALVIDAMA